ncbi:eukaryotic translation initiation factor 4B [Episyrphus balteatus]|uniref:eukaryotic translation initiation factor 4B n=1 Tax=Episyrphus balteatus TaxID=286459 RepID=UPI002486BE8E|nr:eukaryotic translation initiation factor 4B [Episyrphus balteatus]
MASSGKKGKKNKGTVISLQSFLANGEPQAGITQVAKKVRNYGNDSDDDDGSLPQVYQLPTAPRASRIFDDDSIPHKPPFLAYISNLPFDANEDDIHDFFYPTELVSLRLPREDGETGRVRGFGYAEFETRDDLIHVISLPDPQVKNRRVRIEVSNENEQQSNQRRNRDGGDRGDRNNRRGYDVFGSGENRESTNWRRDKEENDGGGRGGGGGGRNYERNFDRGGYNRDRAPREGSGERGGGGSWRTGDRPTYDSSPRRGGGGGDGYRDRFRDRGGDRNDRGGFERGGDGGGRSRREDDAPQQERPKLNLKPRTLPLPEIISKPEEEEESDAQQQQAAAESGSDAETTKAAPRPAGIPAEKVFGSAKPVDTAAREKQIEERLEETRRQERERREKEQKEQENDVSEKLADVELNKDDKETRNTAISSWRRRDEDGGDGGRKNSPDRRNQERRSGGDDRRGRDNRDYNNRDNRNRDRNDRNDRYNKDRPNNREDRPRDDSKQKREPRPDRPMPKYQPPAAGPILQTANKYSGLLDDDGSD